MFDSSNDGILIADVDNKKFFTGNKAICDMLGYSIEEIRKIGVSDIHPKENLPFVEEQFDKQKRNEITLAENIPMKRKDGSVFFADIKSNSITLSGKKCLLGSFRDITERRRAAEELKKAHLELEQRVVQRTAALQQVNTQLLRTIEERDRIQKILQETEKLAGAGKLAAQIAHEINNPLAGIKNSFLLVKDAIPSNHRYFEYVGRIEKEINRVSQIVKQTFDLYRPDMRSPDKFRVSETLRDIAELLKIASEEKQVQIKIDCPYETTVTLSEALFRQVIFNIVQNAIQASPPQSSIEIAAVTSNSMLRVQVSDEGSGIDEKIKDKIFEPFFTTGTGGPKSGLGLGLAITKDIINAMEGKIYFENRRPAGTVFHISIPIPDEPKS
jgi:PAS domain S-box-containing protein